MHQGERRKRERGALGLSVLLHGLVAPFVVAMVIGVDDLRPEGRTAMSGLFSISILHRAAPAPVRPAPAQHATVREAALVVVPSRAAHPRIVAAAKRETSGARNKTRHIAFMAPPPTPMPTPTHVPRAAPRPIPAQKAQTVAAAPPPAPASTPAETAAERPAPPSTPPPAALVDAPVGGWGQNFHDPMVLDDDALAALRSRYHGAVAHVDVDEEGHATRVSVEGPGLDAEALSALERRLLGLRYVPAECNGLRCAASLELRV